MQHFFGAWYTQTPFPGNTSGLEKTTSFRPRARLCYVTCVLFFPRLRLGSTHAHDRMCSTLAAHLITRRESLRCMSAFLSQCVCLKAPHPILCDASSLECGSGGAFLCFQFAFKARTMKGGLSPIYWPLSCELSMQEYKSYIELHRGERVCKHGERPTLP